VQLGDTPREGADLLLETRDLTAQDADYLLALGDLLLHEPQRALLLLGALTQLLQLAVRGGDVLQELLTLLLQAA